MKRIEVLGILRDCPPDGEEQISHLGDFDYFGAALLCAKECADARAQNEIVVMNDDSPVAVWTWEDDWAAYKDPPPGEDSMLRVCVSSTFERIWEECRGADVENYIEALAEDANEYKTFSEWKRKEGLLQYAQKP